MNWCYGTIGLWGLICVIAALLPVAWLMFKGVGSKRQRCFWATLTMGLALCAGTKPPAPSVLGVDWDRTYISFKNAVVTEGSDVVTLQWTYNAIAADDKLHIDVRNKGDEEAEWIELFVGSMSGQLEKNPETRAGAWTGEIADKENKIVYLWCEYVPPPQVHTNGVFHLDGVMRAMDDESETKFVTPGIEVFENDVGLTVEKEVPSEIAD